MLPSRYKWRSWSARQILSLLRSWLYTERKNQNSGWSRGLLLKLQHLQAWLLWDLLQTLWLAEPLRDCSGPADYGTKAMAFNPWICVSDTTHFRAVRKALSTWLQALVVLLVYLLLRDKSAVHKTDTYMSHKKDCSISQIYRSSQSCRYSPHLTFSDCCLGLEAQLLEALCRQSSLMGESAIDAMLWKWLLPQAHP